jgi:peptide/nickel transport system substrate-binding protein
MLRTVFQQGCTRARARLLAPAGAWWRVLGLVATLAACRQVSTPQQAPAAPAQRGGTLVVGLTSEPTGVNELVYTANVITDEMVELQLVRLLEEQPDYERHPPTFRPLLASSYEWSPDHLVLTFHLRPAQWSDGVPITADDVRWTWQMELNPAVAWTNSYAKKSITEVEVVDPHTARFHFDHVYSKQLLDANEGPILPRHAWQTLPAARWRESGDWFKQHFVASGPFVLDSWRSQQEVVLRRNPRYWRPDRPYLDRIVFRIIPSQASQLAALLAGEIDFMVGVAPRDASRVQANPRLALLPSWSRSWIAVAWNTQRQLFADAAVRRALTLAIDRQAIVDTLWFGFARVGDSPVLTTTWAHDPALHPWPYDPQAARRDLVAQGWVPGKDGILERHGQRFAFELATNVENRQRADAAVMIQAQLRRVGIDVKVPQLEFNLLSDLLDQGKFDAAIMGTAIDTGLDLTSTLGSKAIGGENLPRMVNPEIDALIRKSLSHPEPAEARPDLFAIERLVSREQPFTFLWESQRLAAYNRRLHDVRSNAVRSLFRVEDWWVEGRKP